MKKYTIKQTFACDNKWDEMTPHRQGRHCGSCNKVVVDFTQMSDMDIIQYLSKNTHTCGLFKKSQFNRPMVIHSYQKRSSWPAVATMLVAGLFAVAPSNVNALNPGKLSIEFHSTIQSEVEPEKNKEEFPIQLLNAKNNQLITWGSVYVEGLGTFSADEHGTIHVINTDEEKMMPESYLVTVYAGGYISKTFRIYTKDLQQCTGATIYLEEQTEDISPPGMIAIDIEEPPQKTK